MAKSKQYDAIINIRYKAETEAALNVLAKKNNRTFPDYVRKILELAVIKKTKI